MADNFQVTPGSGKTVLGDEVVDGVLGTGTVQFMKLMDGTLDGTTKAAVGARGLAVEAANLQGAAVTAAWTSATSVDTTLVLATVGYASATISVRAGTTLTSGTLVFEQDDGSGTWFTLPAYRIDTTSMPSPSSSLSPAASTNYLFIASCAGVANVRVRVNPVLAGTGTVNLRITPVASKDVNTPAVSIGGANSIPVNIPVGSASQAAHAEDGAAGDGDGGLAVFFKRADAPAGTATTSTDGDYTHPITDSSGRQRVTVIGEQQAQSAQALSVAGSGGSTNSTTNCVLDVSRMGNATLTMSGTWTVTAGSPPTIVFEASDDNGTTWFPLAGARSDTGVAERVVYAAAGSVRQWDFPCGGITHIRARLSANNPATGSISIRISSGGMYGDPITSVNVTRGTTPTYQAVGRLAAVNAAGSLTFTHVANTDKQYFVIQHANTATKLVKIRKVELVIVSNSLAGENGWDLRRTNAAGATGNPAITPEKVNPADAAAEATVLALPTTAAADVAAAVSVGMVGMQMAAAPTLTTPIVLSLYDANLVDVETPPLILRPYTAEGIAIWGRSTVASVIRFIPRIIFTEE